MDDEALRTLIALKVKDGRLPRNGAPRVFGGPGHGEKCDACGESIKKEQMAIEGTTIAAGGGRPMQLHANCFAIWNAIRPHTGEGKIA